MTVAILIPFHGRDPRRLRAKRIVMRMLEQEFAAWRLIIGISGKPFSRGNAINRAASITSESVLVFHDADTLVRPEQLLTAAILAAQEPGLVFAYTDYFRLGEAETEALTPETWEWAFNGPFEWGMRGAPSHSATAISAGCFGKLGGYDESYVGWGYEDCDLTARARALWGEPRRVPGPLVHLWHGDRRSDDSPLSEDPELIAANLRRFQASV